MRIPKPHLSRKVVLIVGAALVMCGGTGAAAVFIGADTLLGPSYAELNGFACTEVQTVEIHKKDRFWVRKYITTDEPADGLGRVKTALRVAKAVQAEKKADLVQVVVLDKAGPTSRALIRGRAVGADIIYVPDPSRVPEEASARHLTARYADGLAAANGQFFGERFDMQEADIAALVARLDDSTDCLKPEIALPEGDAHGAAAGHEAAPADAHGEAPASGHGEAEAHGEAPADGHGDAPADGHGEAPADGHGEAPAGEHGEETPVAEHGAEESKGWMASLMGMVGLGGEEAAAEAHGAGAEGGHDAAAEAGHGEAAGEGHAAATEGHGEAAGEGHDAATDGHGETASDGHAAPGDAGHAATDAVEHAALPAEAHPAVEADPHAAPASEHGDAAHSDASAAGHDAAVNDHDPAKARDGAAETEAAPVEAHGEGVASGHEAPAPEAEAEAAKAHEAVVEEAPVKAQEAAAEEKGWFDGLKSMVGLGGDDEPAPAEDHAAASEEEGAATAPIQGEDWLAKMRAAPIEGTDAEEPSAAGHAGAEEQAHGAEAKPAAQEGHTDAPAEDEAILPPKAKPQTDEHADAGH